MKPSKASLGRNFSLMVLGQIISLFGTAILRFALSLYVLDISGSATLFGGVLAAAMVPTVLLSPLGGVLADRIPRQKIMYVLDFITAIAVWNFALFGRNGSVLPPAALLLALSAISACYHPSVASAVPLLVEESQLTRANGLVSQVQALSGLLGPILGGMVYGFWGMGTICLISAACFLASAVMECFLRIPFVPQKSKGGAGAVLSDLREAGSFLSRSGLFPLLLSFAGANLFLSSCYNVAVPYYVKITLGLSSQLYSLVEGAMALGNITGALLVGILGSRLSYTRTWRYLLCSVTSLAAMALTMAFVPFPMAAWVLILLSCLTGCLFAALLSILTLSFFQQMTPPNLLGKVSGFTTMVATCAMPLGQGLYGILVAHLPPWSVFSLGFAACLPLVAVVRRSMAGTPSIQTENFSEDTV